MQGSASRVGWASLLLFGLLPGCSDTPPVEVPEPETTPLAGHFNAAACGTITGRVTWSGPLPRVPPFRSTDSPYLWPPRVPERDWPNPHAPCVDASGGVADAVVFLRGIDPERSRPWDHPPVTVNLSGCQMTLRQGDASSKAGFVRRGKAVTFVSEDAVAYVIRARGDAFFSLALIEPRQPRARALRNDGVIELSCGSGRFWMRRWLFVAEHPYYGRTDAHGRFALPSVPEGDYELVLWMPNWKLAEVEADSTWGLTSGVIFRPPVEVRRPIRVHRGRAVAVDLTLSAGVFSP